MCLYQDFRLFSTRFWLNYTESLRQRFAYFGFNYDWSDVTYIHVLVWRCHVCDSAPSAIMNSTYVITSRPILYTVTGHTTYVTASIVTGPTYVTASRPIVTCSTYVTASAATCTLCTSICISQCRDGSFSVGLCCSSISCPTLFNQCQFCLSISIHFGDFNEEDAEVDTASGATRWIIMEDATVLGLISRGSESTRNGISSSADEWKDVRREMWVDKRKAWLMDEKRGWSWRRGWRGFRGKWMKREKKRQIIEWEEETFMLREEGISE